MFSIVVAVNNEDVLSNNLLASPLIAEDNVSVICEYNHKSISLAYNCGLKKSTSDYVVFAHQDVYIPKGWEKKLFKNIIKLNRFDPDWAVIGLIGIDEKNNIKGRVWSTGLDKEIIGITSEPEPIVSCDELLFIMRTDLGLKFDNNLPGFHLYATDIIQTAFQKGFKSYAINAPVIHNSFPILKLDEGYFNAYRYFQNKWKSKLPIKTTVLPITRLGWPLLKRRIRQLWRTNKSRNCYIRLQYPRHKAKQLCYE